MQTTTIILSGIAALAMIIYFMPGILALNRGKVLRNMALWLAIFAGLALIYKTFGPGSTMPLFGLPPGMTTSAPATSSPTDNQNTWTPATNQGVTTRRK